MLKLNQIHKGDCLKLMTEIPDNSIDLIITDPPYKTTARGNYGNTGGMLKSKMNMKGQVFQHNNISPSQYAPELYRILKDSAHCYIMTNHVNLIEMLNTFTNAGFHFTKSLIWDKHNKIMGRFYMSQFEYILFFRKGKGKQINNCGTSDILSIPQHKQKDQNGKNLHDTEKPVELMSILIENSSNVGDTVLDPFCGIGSTCIAGKLLRRNYIGIEIDEKYWYITINRLKKENPHNLDVIKND